MPIPKRSTVAESHFSEAACQGVTQTPQRVTLSRELETPPPGRELETPTEFHSDYSIPAQRISRPYIVTRARPRSLIASSLLSNLLSSRPCAAHACMYATCPAAHALPMHAWITPLLASQCSDAHHGQSDALPSILCNSQAMTASSRIRSGWSDPTPPSRVTQRRSSHPSSATARP